MPSVANSNYSNDARLSYVVNQVASVSVSISASASASATALLPSVSASAFPTFSPPRIASLVASSSAEDLSSFGDVTFDIFDDDDDLFGSPMAFDASEQGLWNGRFVPPPPRPPFFVDEPVLSDGLTTCDLCSWAMPTKSTFMFEGTIEKATELGWPLTLIIVSVLSALLGAIIMIAVVRCRRKKSSNNRNDTHVQWWSRNKRAHGNGLSGAGGASGAAGGAGGSVHHHHNGSSSNINNNHLRRSNIYTAHPADSIRGLQPLPVVMPLPLPLPHPPSGGASPASSSLTTPPAPHQQQQQQQQQQHSTLQQQQYFHPYQQQQHVHHSHTHHHHTHHHVPLYPHDCDEDAAYEEPEYHQPQQLHSVNSSSSLSSMGSTSLQPESSNSRATHWPPGATSATMVIAS
ncbi:uncharacterized protein LOC6533199 [Drosophila yakuba]|uniref:Uncharacterized protein, isoform A n=1 Tax=Drosophila yakuba TaxID=7245 RepID=B4PJN8_DROYA|nr:uncharacterized protein LOC6533199 [Drosophila yakuba]EDW93637.1 uncharacterized protein Dyak_GE20484, isoform A [Drosophila yakuba]KRK01282.1 uncharacterized protein Dyak_GE20484, isoform B [Drosophila yakuba]